MPWKEETVEDQRRTFCARADAFGCNFSALCREFGISRATGYKWLERYRGGNALRDRSRAPLARPRKTEADVENLLQSVRQAHPTWGARKILRYLENHGGTGLPAASTVAAILKRNGFITPEESAAHTAFKRFQRDTPNDLWQMDFKGHFGMLDGNRCHPLTMKDDHSRQLLCLDAYENERWSNVKTSLERVFNENGLPNTILCDNGAPWADNHQGYTPFERWLMDLDILPIHGRIKHPQTQGKIERFHKTMKQELLNHTPIVDIADAERKLCLWRDKYNNLRPHEALGMRCPAEVYEPSRRPYCEVIRPYEYGGEYHVIKVNSWGYVRFANWQIYLSETMIDRYIEFRPSQDGETFFACYRNFKIAEFSTEDGHLIHRLISRL